MAKAYPDISVELKWWLRPAVKVALVLIFLRLTSHEAAGAWLTKHGMTIRVGRD